MALLTYDFTIEYKEGPSNTVADYLSRTALVEAMRIDQFENINIRAEQDADQKIRDIKNAMDSRIPESASEAYARWLNSIAEDCFIEDKILWRNLRSKGMRDRTVLVTPQVIRKELMQAAHSAFVMGHASANKMYLRLSQ